MRSSTALFPSPMQFLEVQVRPGRLAVVLCAAAAVALSGCTLVKNDEDGDGGDSGVDIFFEDKDFDPDKMAGELWEPQVLPYLKDKAGDLAEVKALIAEDPDAAGARFGYREKAEGSPFIIATELSGTIVAANTESRASTIDVDIDGDGAEDATIQIGPVVRGTALRDALDFVPFGSFTNQIDYARFGKALNGLVNEAELGDLPRDDLVGRSVTVLGVFPLTDPQAVPVVTVAEITVGDQGQ